ncbi:MAG: hypothetical protein NVSMB49_23730 [Ktedonobacteraceae bacterium]
MRLVWVHVPSTISGSALSAVTVLLTLSPLSLPTWAALITWGGTLLLQDTTLQGSVKKMCPPLILGASFGVLTRILYGWSSSIFLGQSAALVVVMDMLILFSLVLLLLQLCHLPVFSVSAATFFAFAAFVGIAAGKCGPAPHTLLVFWLTTIGMTCLGPLLAWMTNHVMVPVFQTPAPQTFLLTGQSTPDRNRGQAEQRTMATLSPRAEKKRIELLPLEAQLAELVARELRVDAQVESGFDLLVALHTSAEFAHLLCVLQETFQIVLTQREVLASPTIVGLATLIATQRRGALQAPREGRAE